MPLNIREAMMIYSNMDISVELRIQGLKEMLELDGNSYLVQCMIRELEDQINTK